MKPWTRALIAIGLFLFPCVALAQSTPPAGIALVPGSADVIHDVLGIAIGMPCDEAILKAKSLSDGHNSGGKIPWLAFGQSGGEVRFNKATTKFSYTDYQLTIHNFDSTKTQDIVDFNCLEDGASRQIFSIHRLIHFSDPKISPNTSSLVGAFQEKYGVPSIIFSPTFLATMFSQTGIISSPNNECGNYQNSHFYESVDLGFIDFDKFKCSYTLTFRAVEARDPPGAISELDLRIIDFLRLGNTVRDMEKHRLESTPTVVPKL